MGVCVAMRIVQAVTQLGSCTVEAHQSTALMKAILRAKNFNGRLGTNMLMTDISVERRFLTDFNVCSLLYQRVYGEENV